MRKIPVIAAASALVLAVGFGPASADECSGHNHDTGTIVGGVGGAAIGGLASHSVVGALAGGAVGALAGNAIARSNDCDRRARADMEDRHDAYQAGRDDQAYHDYSQGQADNQQAYEAGRARQQADDDTAAADRQAQNDRAYQEGRAQQAGRDADAARADEDQYPK